MESAVAVADFVGMWVTRRVIHISIKMNIKYISCRYKVYTKLKNKVHGHPAVGITVNWVLASVRL